MNQYIKRTQRDYLVSDSSRNNGDIAVPNSKRSD